jgi:acyl carrier protein
MNSEQEIFASLQTLMSEMFELDTSNVTPDSTLEALDIDSIDAVDMLVRIHEMTGKRIKPEDFKSVLTIGDIAAALNRILNPA